MPAQDVQGLLSPFVRNVRLKQASQLIKPSSAVLDLACGSGSLADFLPSDCRYFGVDRISVHRTSQVKRGASSRQYLELDLMAEGNLEAIDNWLPEPVDYITVLAFLEHIGCPEQFLARLARFLKSKNARIVGTTPHPVGRLLHDSLSQVYLCSRDGAEEHEKFLDKTDLQALGSSLSLKLTTYKRFLLGLNQLFVFECV